MDSQIPSLKAVVLQFICKNFDKVFEKKLHKIKNYLKEQGCKDCTEFFIENEEKEQVEVEADAVEVLRAFVKAHHFPKILWKETTQKGGNIFIGLEIENVAVEVHGSFKWKRKARNVAAQLMVAKLYSKYLADPILNKYRIEKEAHKRRQVYETESVLRKTVPACTINSIDELQEYEFTEWERWEMLRKIPEYRLRRSHLMLLLHPKSQRLDFSLCPELFTSLLLELAFKKAKNVKSVILKNCNKAVTSDSSIVNVLRKCSRDSLQYLNINNCGSVNSEAVFRSLRKYDIPLKQLYISNTIKKNAKGSLEFQKFFTSSYGRGLLALDLSGLTLCENEMLYILKNCKRLEKLTLEDTKFETQCYCENHSAEHMMFETTVIEKLKVLNLCRSSFKDRILRLLVDSNRGLDRLYVASTELTSVVEPVDLRRLDNLRYLDISFLGNGAYEDFSVYKQDLTASLRWLNASSYCDVDISHLSVTSPYLNSLILNSSIIDLNMACAVREDTLGGFVSVPHSIKNFTHLVRLELRFTKVDLLKFLESSVPLPLEELIIEGDVLNDDILTYIVNSRVSIVVDDETERMEHVFRSLSVFHICNCNNVTDFGIEQSDFGGLPSLKNLTIERCSGIRVGKLVRLQKLLKSSPVSLTSFIQDERPRFHAMNECEIVMG